MPPLFSVIVPVRDDPLLPEALQSVLDQSIEDLELLVVDDQSNPSVSIEDADPRILLLRNDIALGPAGARNRALAVASGDYVAFLDSDDLYKPDRLASTLDGHRMADIVVVQPVQSAMSSPSLVDPASFLRGITPHLGCTTVRRSAVGRFDETYRACEDVDWWIRMAVSGIEVAIVDADVWVWRRGDHPREIHGHGARLASSYRLLEQHNGFFLAHTGAAAFRWLRIGSMEREAGHPIRALRAVARAVRCKPLPAACLEVSRIALAIIRLAHQRLMPSG